MGGSPILATPGYFHARGPSLVLRDVIGRYIAWEGGASAPPRARAERGGFRRLSNRASGPKGPHETLFHRRRGKASPFRACIVTVFFVTKHQSCRVMLPGNRPIVARAALGMGVPLKRGSFP